MVVLILLRRPMWKFGIIMNAFAMVFAILVEEDETSYMFLNLLLIVKKPKEIGPDYAWDYL